MPPHLAYHVLRQLRLRIDHREDNAVQVERRIRRGADSLDRAGDKREAVHREELRLDRDQHSVGRDERARHHDAERRRAVEDYVVERARFLDWREGVPDDFKTVFAHRKLKLRAGEVDFRGNDVEAAPLRRLDNVRNLLLAEKDRIERHSLAFFEPKAERRVSLRIKVDDKHSALPRREGGREIHDRRRLPYAALLVRNRYYLRSSFHSRLHVP